MKRLLLAGVSLTVTACATQPVTSPSAVSSTKYSSKQSEYILSLAATQQCTLWRDVGGQRVCLDGASDQAAKPEPVPAQIRRASRLERAPGADFSDASLPATKGPAASATIAPIAAVKPIAPGVQAAPQRAAKSQMPQTAGAPMQGPNLAEEMQRIGMLDSAERVKGALPRMKLTQTASAARALPKLPTTGPAPGIAQAIVTPPMIATADLPRLPEAAQSVIAAPKAASVPVRQAFAPDPVESAAKPARKAATAAAMAEMPRWRPVEKPSARTQIAAGESMKSAPVTPVERAELPAVRPNAVVPLKIIEKGVDGKPSVVEPAIPAGSGAIAAAPPPSPPTLPALPQLPGAAAPAPQAQPAAPAPTLIAAPAGKPAFVPPPPPPSALMQPATPAAATQPLARQSAKPAAKTAAKPAPNNLPSIASSAAPAQSGTRYLVLHSFKDRRQAASAARRYTHHGATVATAQIQGQTWYRVVVRDGADRRSRLSADGVRGYWPVTL